MQAKCLAQHLARGQRWGTEAAVLLAAVVWSWQQTGPGPEGGGPAQRDRPRDLEPAGSSPLCLSQR